MRAGGSSVPTWLTTGVAEVMLGLPGFQVLEASEAGVELVLSVETIPAAVECPGAVVRGLPLTGHRWSTGTCRASAGRAADLAQAPAPMPAPRLPSAAGATVRRPPAGADAPPHRCVQRSQSGWVSGDTPPPRRRRRPLVVPAWYQTVCPIPPIRQCGWKRRLHTGKRACCLSAPSRLRAL